jgi:protein required for attachment to host cells
VETTWIMVAHRSGARLFENKGRGRGFKLVADIPHPEGRLKNQDIDADKQGRSFDRFGYGRHAMSQEVEPKKHIAERFAKKLAELLDEGRNQHRYIKLVLIAEPNFLGTLRGALSDQTASKVAASLDKDLADVPERELMEHLREIIPS